MIDDACMIPSSLFEPEPIVPTKEELKIIELYRKQTDSMKQAIKDILETTKKED